MKCIPYYFLKNNRATWPIAKRSTPSKMECKGKLNANKTHKINPAHAIQCGKNRSSGFNFSADKLAIL